MTPLAIAAMCGVLYSPPASWDAVSLPRGALVIEAPLENLKWVCKTTADVGCTRLDFNVAYIPTWASWHGTRECWLEVRRHEEAHLKGYVHP